MADILLKLFYSELHEMHFYLQLNKKETIIWDNNMFG